MPEGHTIRRLALDLNKTLKPGPVAASSPQGPFSEGAAHLDGKRLIDADSWGKHLFCEFKGAPLLHIHLGLIGKLRQFPADREVEGAIRLRLIGEEKLWDLTGPMVCSLIDDDDQHVIIDKLGPDPLRTDSDPEVFAERLSRRRIPIAAALLDQKVIAGIGTVSYTHLTLPTKA